MKIAAPVYGLLPVQAFFEEEIFRVKHSDTRRAVVVNDYNAGPARITSAVEVQIFLRLFV